MALTYSPPGSIGSRCPDFALPSVDGKLYQLADFKDTNGLVILFICNHCPYVKAIEDRLLALAKHFSKKSVQFVAICSNDPSENPEDAPEALLIRWQEKRYSFPYLVDGTQNAARAFDAVCTPDLFVYDKARKLQYRGRLDDSWRDPGRVKREELKEAIEAVLQGGAINELQNPSMGCSIKWKSR